MIKSIITGTRLLSISTVRPISQSLISSVNASNALLAASASATKTRATSAKPKVASKKKDPLKAKLAKEKNALKALEKKLKAHTKKLEQKQKQREKAELAAALKPFRKLSGYTFFMKQEKGNKFVDSAAKWKSLSDSEKQAFVVEAGKYNDEQLKIYTPKPKKPATGYALYLKENYVNDGRSIGEIGKALSAQWKALSPNEKARYEVSQTLKDDYARELKKWTEDRLSIHKAKN